MSITDRTITSLVRGRATQDGAGVKLTRILGGPELPMLDPFLMLDEFRSDDPDDYIAGFPNHPHRGFETVTYMLAGNMRHGDNKGNTGLLTAGAAQWMTAGRGIVHSEMPEQVDGLMWGFQLWINLPARDKMIAPRYQDIPPHAIPEVKRDGMTMRVIAGTFEKTTGPVKGIITEPLFLDIRLSDNGQCTIPLPAHHNAFLYVYEGAAYVGADKKPVMRGELAVLSAGNSLQLSGDCRVICLAARPLGEPVARYGPFVMTTKAQIMDAFNDFNSGKF